MDELTRDYWVHGTTVEGAEHTYGPFVGVVLTGDYLVDLMDQSHILFYRTMHELQPVWCNFNADKDGNHHYYKWLIPQRHTHAQAQIAAESD
jgi:hypothetical protein